MVARSFSHLLRAATRVHDGILEKVTRRANLTVQQFAVMEAVREHGPAKNARLSEATGIDRSTIATIIHALQSRGLLSVQRSLHDGRTNKVVLSYRGRAAMAKVASARATADKIFAAPLGRRGSELLAILDEIANGSAPK